MGLTLRELHDDPRKMSSFMGWDYTSDRESELISEIEEAKQKLNDLIQEFESLNDDGLPTGKYKRDRYKSRMGMCEQRYSFYLETIAHRPLAHQWNSFIRECARKEFGIKAKSVGEVQQMCIEMYPYLYTTVDGEFALAPSESQTQYKLPEPQRLI